MEVFAKRNADLNPTDLACNPGLQYTPANAQILKDDVWFPEEQHNEADSQYSHRQLDSHSGPLPFSAASDLSLTENKQHKDVSGQVESFIIHNGLPRTISENVSSEQRAASRSWAQPWYRPTMWNTNNSSKSERIRPSVPGGRWGHVMYNALFDPRRTFPGFGFMYSRPPRHWQPANRHKREPPSFGYLDPSSMVCEYLHNYRNFLRDLRVNMRGGKNYEHGMQWGLKGDLAPYSSCLVYGQNVGLPHHSRPQKESQQQLVPFHQRQHQQPHTAKPQELLSSQFQEQQYDCLHQQSHHHNQQQLQQRPGPEEQHQRLQHIPDVSPGLWSVLSEISTPQSRDLQIEFSRLMNTVTSTRMRRIWMEGQGQKGQDTGRPGFEKGPTPGTESDALSQHKTGTGVSAVVSGSGDSKEERSMCQDGGCSEMPSGIGEERSKSSRSSGPGLEGRSAKDASFSPLAYQSSFQSIPREGNTSENRKWGLTPRQRPHGDRVGRAEDEDDISSLIDNARLELQIEEEEEEEVKQNLQLLLLRRQQAGLGAGRQQEGCVGDAILYTRSSSAPAHQRLGDVQRSGTAHKGLSERHLQAAGEEDYARPYRQEEPSQSNLVDPKADSRTEECERQVLFVLRKSTVNHHLSQDLQKDEITVAPPYATFSPTTSSWQPDASQSTLAPPRPEPSGIGYTGYDDDVHSVQTSVDLSVSSASPCNASTVNQEGNAAYKLDKESNFLPSVQCGFSLHSEALGGHKPCLAPHRDSLTLHTPSQTDNACSSDSLPVLSHVLNTSPGKIRILGSKSYSEAYTEGQHGLDDCCPRDCCAEQMAGARDGTNGPPKNEASSAKEPNRKPVVVSVRPLSHATRRASHSYITQRPANRHRQCQSKQHSNRHRQDCGGDRPSEATDDHHQTESSSGCGGAAEGKDRRTTGLCATQSTHETQQQQQQQQDGQAQRRSASESDVFVDNSDQKNRKLMIQTSGSGDTTTTTSLRMISTSVSSQGSSDIFSFNSYASGRCVPCPVSREGDLQLDESREQPANPSVGPSDPPTKSITSHCPGSWETFSGQPASAQSSLSHDSASGIFYSAPGSATMREGVGWKLAKRQMPRESGGSDNTETCSQDCARPGGKDCTSHDLPLCGKLFRQAAESGVLSDSRSGLNVMSSNAQIQSTRSGLTDSTQGLADFSAELTSPPHSSVDTCPPVTIPESTCPPLSETVTSKPYAQVFPQGQHMPWRPQSVISNVKAAHSNSGLGDTSRASLTEAAFAEQIACSAVGFQPESFYKYWENASSGAHLDTWGWGSKKDPLTYSSAFLKSLQRLDNGTDQASSNPPPAASSDSPVCAQDVSDKAFYQSSHSSQERDTSAAKQPEDCLQKAPNVLKAGNLQHRPYCLKPPQSWVPLSTLTATSHSHRESRLLQCYSPKLVTSDYLGSPGKPQAAFPLTDRQASISNTHDRNIDSSSKQETAPTMPISGTDRAGSETRGCWEGPAVGLSDSTSSECCNSTAESGRWGHKERILEEISAWFVDNSGYPGGSRREDNELDCRSVIPVRISQRTALTPAISHLQPQQTERQETTRDSTQTTPTAKDTGLPPLNQSPSLFPLQDVDLVGQVTDGEESPLSPNTPQKSGQFTSKTAAGLNSFGAIGDPDPRNMRVLPTVPNLNAHSLGPSLLATTSRHSVAHAKNSSSQAVGQSHSHNDPTHATSRQMSGQHSPSVQLPQTHSIKQPCSASGLLLHTAYHRAPAHKLAVYGLGDQHTTDSNCRLFSDVARAVGTPTKQQSALPVESGLGGHSKDATSVPTAVSFPMRTDHLCNQHLIPEQFRKLIVPDVDRIMQLGRDNAWNSPPVNTASSGLVSGVHHNRVKSESGVSFGGGVAEKNAVFVDGTQQGLQRGEAAHNSSCSAPGGAQSARGFRITAEELFANYEAAVMGTHSQHGNKATAFKAETLVDEATHGHGHAPCDATNCLRSKPGVAGGYQATCCTIGGLSVKTSGAIKARHVSQIAKPGGQSVAVGRALTVEHKAQQGTIFASCMPATRESRHGFAVQQQPQQLQQHQQKQQQQQQQQALPFASHTTKCREQVMTAAYYANTRLNDVMTYASINIPGLPRIPILSPQAAAQNAFMMKANNMRPCLQPNLSVPPPGFIPLLPVPTGPTFHPAPTTFPVGPIFQPGVFHSPNFIAMAPHPQPPTFMQQTKVNICANVNINSSVSATFNVNSSNNRADSHNPVLGLNTGAFRPSPVTTTTTSASSSVSSCSSSITPSSLSATDSESKSLSESRAGAKASSPREWCPLTLAKTGSSLSLPPKFSTARQGDTVHALHVDTLQRGGAGLPLVADNDLKGPPGRAAGRAGSEEARCAEDGRVEQNPGQAGSCLVGDSSSLKCRQRGSNMDNLIHVFPPRQ